jgi:hypothetical protein
MQYLAPYIVIGLVVLILITLADRETKEFFAEVLLEFGFIGVVVCAIITVLIWPYVIYCIVVGFFK